MPQTWNCPVQPARIHLPLLLTAALALAPPGLPQEPEGSARFDVRAIESTFLPTARGVDLRLPLESAFLANMEPSRHVPVRLEEPFTMDEDLWQSFLSECLEAEGVEDFFGVGLQAGFLEVEGPPQVLERVGAIIADLERHLLRTVDLEAIVLDPDSVPPGTGAVLSSEEVDALLAAAVLVEYVRASAPLGRRARLSTRSSEAQLIDYDVEVAEAQSVNDPQVTVIQEGSEVGAVVHATVGGGFFVRTWARRAAQRGVPREVETRIRESSPVRLPRVASTLSAGSGWIPDGGGLLLGHDRDPEGLWLLRVRDGSRASDEPQRSPFVPVGCLLAPPLVPSLPQVYGATPSGGWSDEDLLDDIAQELARPVYRNPYQFMDSLAGDMENREGGLHLLGSAVYAHGSQALLDRTIERVRNRSAPLLRTVEMDLRIGLAERSVAARLARGELSPADLAPELESRLSGACRVGDCMLVVGGEESYYVCDYDVEIASGSSMADPVLQTTFEGFTFWCRPTVATDGTVVAWTDLVWVQPLRDRLQVHFSWTSSNIPKEGPVTAPPTRSTGIFELPKSTRTALRSTLMLEPGSWTLLTCAGLEGTERVLVVVAKASVHP